MMAMTPHEQKQLDELEFAFLETVERVSPVAEQQQQQQAMKTATSVVPQPGRSVRESRGWFSRMKERFVMQLVCCAPPRALLDDFEIEEILAKFEEPAAMTKPTTQAASRKELLQRKNSASIAPFSLTSERLAMPAPESDDDAVKIDGHAAAAPLSDITHVLGELPSPRAAIESVEKVDLPMTSNVEDELTTHDMSSGSDDNCDSSGDDQPAIQLEKSTPQLHFSRVAMLMMCVSKLHAVVRVHQQGRAAAAIQQSWRRQRVQHAVRPAISCIVEPENEPEAIDVAVASPKRRRRRLRKHRGRKKTKLSLVDQDQDQVQPQQEASEQRSSSTQNHQAMARKRSRSVVETIESRDVERDVHVLFGEEEIDDDDFVPHALLPRVAQPLRRRSPVLPPTSALRPVPIKSRTLVHHQAARTIQLAWRSMKARQELHFLRHLKQREAERQSVMPTIRSKMAVLRRRLEQLQERPIAEDADALEREEIDDDDFNWL